MGGITEKLNHLAGTKEEIKKALIKKGAVVEDNDTFRSYAEKIKNIETNERYKQFLNYINGGSHWSYDIETVKIPNVNGGYSIFDRVLMNSNGLEYEMLVSTVSNRAINFVMPSGIKTSDIFRKMYQKEHYSSDNIKCLNIKLSDIKTPTTVNVKNEYPLFDLSRLEFDATYQNGNIIFFMWDDSLTNNIIPRLLYFPDYLDIESGKYILNISTSNTAKYSPYYLLEYGIHFGKSVKNFTTTSIRYTMQGYATRDILVTVKKGFYGTLYLSKIPMSAKTMIGIFENLKDLNGTDEQYIINIGTENSEKLTPEQLEIATNKGWTVT